MMKVMNKRRPSPLWINLANIKITLVKVEYNENLQQIYFHRVTQMKREYERPAFDNGYRNSWKQKHGTETSTRKKLGQRTAYARF